MKYSASEMNRNTKRASKGCLCQLTLSPLVSHFNTCIKMHRDNRVPFKDYTLKEAGSEKKLLLQGTVHWKAQTKQTFQF